MILNNRSYLEGKSAKKKLKIEDKYVCARIAFFVISLFSLVDAWWFSIRLYKEQSIKQYGGKRYDRARNNGDAEMNKVRGMNKRVKQNTNRNRKCLKYNNLYLMLLFTYIFLKLIYLFINRIMSSVFQNYQFFWHFLWSHLIRVEFFLAKVMKIYKIYGTSSQFNIICRNLKTTWLSRIFVTTECIVFFFK